MAGKVRAGSRRHSCTADTVMPGRTSAGYGEGRNVGGMCNRALATHLFNQACAFNTPGHHQRTYLELEQAVHGGQTAGGGASHQQPLEIVYHIHSTSMTTSGRGYGPSPRGRRLPSAPARQESPWALADDKPGWGNEGYSFLIINRKLTGLGSRSVGEGRWCEVLACMDIGSTGTLRAREMFTAASGQRDRGRILCYRPTSTQIVNALPGSGSRLQRCRYGFWHRDRD